MCEDPAEDYEGFLRQQKLRSLFEMQFKPPPDMLIAFEHPHEPPDGMDPDHHAQLVTRLIQHVDAQYAAFLDRVKNE